MKFFHFKSLSITKCFVWCKVWLMFNVHSSECKRFIFLYLFFGTAHLFRCTNKWRAINNDLFTKFSSNKTYHHPKLIASAHNVYAKLSMRLMQSLNGKERDILRWYSSEWIHESTELHKRQNILSCWWWYDM